MATAKRLNEQIDDITECPICTKMLTDAKVLPCVHSFCLKCLCKYGKDNTPGDKVSCPLCKKNFTLAVGGFEALPNNWFVNKKRKRAVKLVKSHDEDKGSILQQEVEHKFVPCTTTSTGAKDLLGEIHYKQTGTHASSITFRRTTRSAMRGTSLLKEPRVGLDVSLFLRNPQVVKVLQRDELVTGIAMMRNEMFIVQYKSQQIEVYDSQNFSLVRNITVSEMKSPSCLVACPQNNCLYISDTSIKHIHRVELSNESVIKWPVDVDGNLGGLSVTSKHNLLVTLYNTPKISEYTTRGSLVRCINLDSSIVSPRHSVELSTGQFAVCHGLFGLHRVCIIDSEGQIIKSYGTTRGSAPGHLNNPFSLVVDRLDNLLVADYFNNKEEG